MLSSVIKVSGEHCHMENRNGIVDLTAISVEQRYDGNTVAIEGIGKRHRIVRGGININREAAIEMALAILNEYRPDLLA